MNVNRLLGILAILLLTAANALYAQKPVKVKGVQGHWQVSDDITLKQAEERAFSEESCSAESGCDGKCVVGIWPDHPGRRPGAS